MSRSRKYHTFIKICGSDSNKKDKTIANRKFRKINKLRIKVDKEPLHNLKEISNTYCFNSDGLAFYISKKEYEQYRNLLSSRYGRSEANIEEDWRKMMNK